MAFWLRDGLGVFMQTAIRSDRRFAGHLVV